MLEFHTSIPPNPDIANAFFKCGLTEAWGRGIEKIIKSNVNAGKPKPTFETLGNGLRVTFYSDLKVTTNATINIDLNSSQERILSLMEENPKITAEMISSELGITERHVRKNIKKLKDERLIERIGSNKAGVWRVKLGDS